MCADRALSYAALEQGSEVAARVVTRQIEKSTERCRHDNPAESELLMRANDDFTCA